MALNEFLGKLVPVKKGDSVAKVASSERINAIQEAIKAMAQGEHIKTGKNLRRKVGSGFVMLTADDQGRRREGEEKNLQLYDATDGDGAKVGITFGTVAGLVPDGWFDYLADPETTANPYILVAGAGFGRVWATVTIDQATTLGVPTMLEFDTGSTVPPDTNNEVHLTIGTYINDEASVRAFSGLAGSQTLVLIIFDASGEPFLQPYWGVV